MAVEARASCGDCNTNNNNKVILVKITTDFIFYGSISWNTLKFTWNNLYLWTGNWVWGWIEWRQIYDTQTIIVTGPSKQSSLRCVICSKGWLEMPALSPVKKERVGLGDSRMGTKENEIAKAGRPCSLECYKKNWNVLLFRNIFFLKFWLTS
jgi:hypothetical protein